MKKPANKPAKKAVRKSAPPSAAIGRTKVKASERQRWTPPAANAGPALVVDNTVGAQVIDTANKRFMKSAQLRELAARTRSKVDRSPILDKSTFRLPDFPKAIIPKKRADRMAFDEQIIEVNAWATQSLFNGMIAGGMTFLGYPLLSELAQIPEYRKITETISTHATRKWIELQSTGAAEEGAVDKSAKIKLINDDLENFKVRDLFRTASSVDGYFGRAHLYIDVEYTDVKELKFPIGNGRDALSRLKVKPGRKGVDGLPKLGNLKGFKIIEPVWCYPSNYDSYNPLTTNWYNPDTWFVMQMEIHKTRCIRMVSKEVPDMLKPTYSFGGLSMTQMARPYVDNWLRTRQSVADLIWSFSVSGVKTNLSTLMQGQGDDLFVRTEIFNNLRNNRGMMLLDKDTEEFFQINTPLGTLDKLQAQAQEFMASVSSIPLVYLLGITPSGLNASSEGEIRAFEDFIAAYQEQFYREPLTTVIDFIQLNRFGAIDPEITFRFVPLRSMDEKELAEVDKMNAETDDLRINGGVIDPLEARKGVANDPNSRYEGLDVNDVPIPPETDDDGDGQTDPGANPSIGGSSLDPGKSRPTQPHSDDQETVTGDEWNEGDHPRGQPGNAGQFGAGGGGGGKTTKGKGEKESLENSSTVVKVASEIIQPAPTPEQRRKDIKSVLDGQPKLSYSYRTKVLQAIEQAKEDKADPLTLAKLHGKMFQYYHMRETDYREKGDYSKADVILKKKEQTVREMNRLLDESKGGGEKPPEIKPEPPKEKPIDAKSKAILDTSHQVARDMGFNPDRISIAKEDYHFKLNGRNCKAAGTAQLWNKTILMYPSQLSDPSREFGAKQVKQVAAHEVMHCKFQTVLENAKYGGELATKYYDIVGRRGTTGPGSHLEAITEMELGDGVSNYSREYWTGYGLGKITEESALHETLAEMAAAKFTGQEVKFRGPARSLNQKNSHSSFKTPMADRSAAQKRGEERWNKLYDLVEEYYPKIANGK